MYAFLHCLSNQNLYIAKLGSYRRESTLFWLLNQVSLQLILFEETGGDSSNEGCFGRKTNLFRESGDFAGNRETLGNFSGNMRYFRDIEQRCDITCYQTICIH